MKNKKWGSPGKVAINQQLHLQGSNCPRKMTISSENCPFCAILSDTVSISLGRDDRWSTYLVWSKWGILNVLQGFILSQSNLTSNQEGGTSGKAIFVISKYFLRL